MLHLYCSPHRLVDLESVSGDLRAKKGQTTRTMYVYASLTVVVVVVVLVLLVISANCPPLCII